MGEALGCNVNGLVASLMSHDDFDLYWPEISRELDYVPHLWQRYHTKDSLRLAVLNGDIDAWTVGTFKHIRLVVFTHIVNHPASRILYVTLALGTNLKECLPALRALLEQLALQAECDYCEIVGRPGWEKILPDFKRSAVVLTKQLSNFKVQ